MADHGIDSDLHKETGTPISSTPDFGDRLTKESVFQAYRSLGLEGASAVLRVNNLDSFCLLQEPAKGKTERGQRTMENQDEGGLNLKSSREAKVESIKKHHVKGVDF